MFWQIWTFIFLDFAPEQYSILNKNKVARIVISCVIYNALCFLSLQCQSYVAGGKLLIGLLSYDERGDPGKAHPCILADHSLKPSLFSPELPHKCLK